MSFSRRYLRLTHRLLSTEPNFQGSNPPESLKWHELPHEYVARENAKLRRYHPHPFTLPRLADRDTIQPDPDSPLSTTAVTQTPRVLFVHQLFPPIGQDPHVRFALAMLGLGQKNTINVLPDVPIVRSRLWKVRHLVKIQAMDTDDVRRLYEWPLHPLSVPHGAVYNPIRKQMRSMVGAVLQAGVANRARWLPHPTAPGDLHSVPFRISPRAVPFAPRGPRTNPPSMTPPLRIVEQYEEPIGDPHARRNFVPVTGPEWDRMGFPRGGWAVPEGGGPDAGGAAGRGDAPAQATSVSGPAGGVHHSSPTHTAGDSADPPWYSALDSDESARPPGTPGAPGGGWAWVDVEQRGLIETDASGTLPPGVLASRTDDSPNTLPETHGWRPAAPQSPNAGYKQPPIRERDIVVSESSLHVSRAGGIGGPRAWSADTGAAVYGAVRRRGPVGSSFDPEPGPSNSFY